MIRKALCCLCFLLTMMGIIISMVACDPGNGNEPVSTASPTPTLTPTVTISAEGSINISEEDPDVPTATPTSPPMDAATTTPTATPSPCEGLTGELEVRILVGPADAVGLESYSAGSVPFAVTTGGPPYGVAGGGNITYHETLVEDEINYDVTFDATIVLDGSCDDTPGSVELALDLDTAWTQQVEVTARDFHGVYPTAGDNAVMITLPLIEGATASIGEGAEIVLHLNQ